MKNALLIIVTLCTTIAQSALAHPGHDHSHWLSPALHVTASTLLASAIVVLITLYIFRKKKIR